MRLDAEIVLDELATIQANYEQVVLVQRLRDVLGWLNPQLSSEVFADAFCKPPWGAEAGNEQVTYALESVFDMATNPEEIDLWRQSPSEHQRLEFKEAKTQFDNHKLYE